MYRYIEIYMMFIPRRRPEGRISLMTLKTSLSELQGPTLPHLYTYSGNFPGSELTRISECRLSLIFRSLLITACFIPICVFVDIYFKHLCIWTDVFLFYHEYANIDKYMYYIYVYTYIYIYICMYSNTYILIN